VLAGQQTLSSAGGLLLHQIGSFLRVAWATEHPGLPAPDDVYGRDERLHVRLADDAKS
jgi:hypothetical protein